VATLPEVEVEYMSRFFFHIEHVKVVKDEEGSEHQDVGAAKLHAVKKFAEILSETPQVFWDSDIFRMTVAKADGLVLFTLEMVGSLAPAIAGLGNAVARPRG
jgi:hypothetical protein